MKTAATLALVAMVLLGCAAPVEPRIDHEGRGTELGDACVSLRAAGCPEGAPLQDDRTCYDHLHDMAFRVRIPTGCIRAARDAAAVRECGAGDRSMLRFRC